MHVRCPQCCNPVDLVADDSLTSIECPSCGSHFQLISQDETTCDAPHPFDLGQFQLIEQVGLGRFGNVWKARDRELDRFVAIKIPRQNELDAAGAEQFFREARAAAQLKHPHIVSVHEVGRHNGTLYIVSDFIDGPNLSEWLSGQRLSAREAAELCAGLADALHHAHEAGVVHRDLKPGNILMDSDGKPYIADFGLAKRDFGETTITIDGKLLGTPAYMPPEQARGEGHAADRRADIYATGVILYELLTGQRPFRGEKRMLIHQILNDEPMPPRKLASQVPRDLETICLKCMEKEPGQRYATAELLAEDLRRYLLGRPIQARPLSPAARTVRWCRRNPAIAGLMATVMGVLLIAAIVSTFFAVHANQQADAATAALYEGLLREIQLSRQARREGYFANVRELVQDARELDAPTPASEDLSREVVKAMGDFVGYVPTVFDEFDAEVAAVALSPDGSRLAIGMADGTLLVFSTGTKERQSQAQPHESPIVALGFSEDGRKLVTADTSGRVMVNILDGDEWQSAASLTIDFEPYWLELSHDGARVAAMSGSSLTVWDIDSAERIHDLQTDPTWTMRSAAFAPSGKRLVAGYIDEQKGQGGWAAWDLDSGERLRHGAMELGYTYPNGIAYSGDGLRLAVGFDEGLLVYDAVEFGREAFRRLDATKAVAFSPDGRYLATADIRGQISLWNEDTGRQAASLSNWGTGPTRESLAFSADGRSLAAANAQSVRVWNLAAADERLDLRGHRGPVPCVAFGPDGRLVSGGKDGLVKFWDSESGSQSAELSVGGPVQCMAFSPEGDWLAIGSWGDATAVRLRVVDTDSLETVVGISPDVGNVYGVALFEKEGQLCLAASGREGLSVWSVDSGKLELLYHEDASRCLDLAVSPDGLRIAWVHDSKQIHVSDLASRSLIPLTPPPMHQGWHGLEFDPDNDRFAFIAANGTAQFWSVANNSSSFHLGEEGQFRSPHIALSGDGNWFAGLTRPDVVSIWNTASKKHVYSFRREESSVWSLAWGASGRKLAVGRNDGGLAIWDLDKVDVKLQDLGLTPPN